MTTPHLDPARWVETTTQRLAREVGRREEARLVAEFVDELHRDVFAPFRPVVTVYRVNDPEPGVRVQYAGDLGVTILERHIARLPFEEDARIGYLVERVDVAWRGHRPPADPDHIERGTS